MLSQIIKFIQIISSETAPVQISAGIALAMIPGFTPLFSIHNLIVLLVLLMLRINIAAFMLALALFTAFAYLLDPAFHSIGQIILTQEDLQNFWTELYNSTFWRLTGFNNTVVMGSLIVSLVALVPTLFLSNFLIRHYRNDILVYLNNSSIFKAFKSSKLFTKIVAAAE